MATQQGFFDDFFDTITDEQISDAQPKPTSSQMLSELAQPIVPIESTKTSKKRSEQVFIFISGKLI
jgi:hypothetical protein